MSREFKPDITLEWCKPHSRYYVDDCPECEIAETERNERITIGQELEKRFGPSAGWDISGLKEFSDDLQNGRMP